MKTLRIAAIGLGIVLIGGFVVEASVFRSRAQRLVSVVRPAKVELKDAPIRKEWITEGQPATRGAEIARTDDDATQVFLWETTASRFTWHYDVDEVITVIDGEVFVTDDSKVERRLGPGDVAFFPYGSVVDWRVPSYVKKIATLKKTLPEPIAGVVRWMRMAKNSLWPTTSALASTP